MSASSRARILQRPAGLTYQQAKQHLEALSLDVRAEGQYVGDIESAPAIVLRDCYDCGRSYFTEPPSTSGFEPSCPFCVGVEDMTTWFFENYEDPANHVPHESAEGGYQYYAGGPYDADWVLQEQFPHATDAMREAAVEEIQRDSFEWVRIGDY
jgi:hypothetical protein